MSTPIRRGSSSIAGRLVRAVVALGLVAVGWGLLGSRETLAASPVVLVLIAKGAVTPVMFSFIDRGIGEAETRDAAAVVIQLDTPGGLDSAMRDIVQRINASRVPVVVYVGPAGARAASAGAFITMAGHVAAMAPNTAIGAAHPVAGGGQQISGPMEDKVVNDAVAYIRGTAQARGRNQEWAERAVRESISTSWDRAVEERVVDFTARDLQDLVRQLHGRRAQLLAGEAEIATTGAAVERVEMTFLETFLFAISDPNVAYLLLSVAMLAIFLELSNPGAVLPGIVGGICLLTALFALGMLPVNIAGLLLIGLGFLLFVAELWVTSHGMLSVGGVISLGLGSLILINSYTPYLQINRWLIAGVVGFFATFFFFLVGVALRSRRRGALRGSTALVGMRGLARTALEPEGTVLVHGELWTARAENGPIQPGEQVLVVEVEGLQLHVTRV
ncbi:MAG: nodulation protein NfeD [Chloroflexi bacterium]|nr:nodulation protein NfeD [Chloroflexota bacterium]